MTKRKTLEELISGVQKDATEKMFCLSLQRFLSMLEQNYMTAPMTMTMIS